MSAQIRRRGAQLGRASVACLQHLATAGTASARELEALQRNLEPNRSPVAIQHTAYNLQSLGYIQRTPAAAGVMFELTSLGHTAVARQPSCPTTSTAAAETRQDATRPVRYGRGFVHLPIAARWVFDLGTTP